MREEGSEGGRERIQLVTKFAETSFTWTTACCSISVYMRQMLIPPCFVFGLAFRHFVTMPATTASHVLLLVTITSSQLRHYDVMPV